MFSASRRRRAVMPRVRAACSQAAPSRCDAPHASPSRSPTVMSLRAMYSDERCTSSWFQCVFQKRWRSSFGTRRDRDAFRTGRCVRAISGASLFQRTLERSRWYMSTARARPKATRSGVRRTSPNRSSVERLLRTVAGDSAARRASARAEGSPRGACASAASTCTSARDHDPSGAVGTTPMALRRRACCCGRRTTVAFRAPPARASLIPNSAAVRRTRSTETPSSRATDGTVCTLFIPVSIARLEQGLGKDARCRRALGGSRRAHNTATRGRVVPFTPLPENEPPDTGSARA